MGIWTFIANACWRESSGIARKIQVILVTVPTAVAFIVGFFGGEWSKDLWPAWVWASLVLAAVIGSIVWGIFHRAYTLEKEKEPKITISDPIEDYEPWGADPQEKSLRRFSIDITNLSTERIANCAVTEFDFVNKYGRHAPETGRHFPKRMDRQADSRTHKFDKVFDLRGKGDSVGIDICALIETRPDDRVMMMYATDPGSPQKNYIDQEVFPHELTVRVTADNLSIPQNKKFKIYVDDKGFLRMETIQ